MTPTELKAANRLWLNAVLKHPRFHILKSEHPKPQPNDNNNEDKDEVSAADGMKMHG